jgi:hypothetical protein
MLGDLIAQLDEPQISAALLTKLPPELVMQIEERAAAVSMTSADFAAGAVRAFMEEGDDELWFQLLTIIRKSDDPGIAAVQTILTWVVTER